MVAVAADPDGEISVATGDRFVLVLRTVADGGLSWRLRPDTANDGVVTATKSFGIDDVFLSHVDDPSSPRMVGGASTSYFAFRAVAKTTASATVTFDEFGPSPDAKPRRTRSFKVAIEGAATC